MTDHVKKRFEGGVLTLRLDRPEKKNALTRGMDDGLAQGLAAAATHDETRVVVLAGGTDFTAGNDLSDFAAVEADQPRPGAAGRPGRDEAPAARALAGGAGAGDGRGARSLRKAASHPGGAGGVRRLFGAEEGLSDQPGARAVPPSCGDGISPGTTAPPLRSDGITAQRLRHHRAAVGISPGGACRARGAAAHPG